MRSITILTLCLLLSAAYAAPILDGDTTIVQDPNTCLVTISYGLKTEPAIVTVDVQTNGPAGYASIDQTALTNVTGDVNNRVAIGKNKKIYWRPDETIPSRFRSSNARAVVTLHATNSPPDYIVLDLSSATAPGAASCRFFPNAEQIPFGVTNRIYKTRYYVMRRIHAAGVPWPMGSVSAETGRSGNELRHFVALPEDYYIGVFEVTQGHMKAVGLSSAVTEQCNVNVADADYCPAAGVGTTKGITHTNIRAGNNWPAGGHTFVNPWAYPQFFRNRVGTKLLFDLPTDAQWEYASRAGRYATAYTHGKDSSDGFGDYAWHKGNVPANSTLQEVGTRLPNGWGLYDMFGNVCEWCLDNFRTDCGIYQADYDDVNFVGPTTDNNNLVDNKVVRGGSYDDDVTNLRSAYRALLNRGQKTPIVGYRLAIQSVYPY